MLGQNLTEEDEEAIAAELDSILVSCSPFSQLAPLPIKCLSHCRKNYRSLLWRILLKWRSSPSSQMCQKQSLWHKKVYPLEIFHSNYGYIAMVTIEPAKAEERERKLVAA